MRHGRSTSRSRRAWPHSRNCSPRAKSIQKSWLLRAWAILRSVAGQTWAQLLKRPEVAIEPVLRALRESLCVRSAAGRARPLWQRIRQCARAQLRNEARAVETEIKFAGYLDQQRKAIEKLKAAEGRRHPRLDRLQRHQRPLARDARNSRARSPRHHRPGQPHSRRHARSTLAGPRVHPRPGLSTATSLEQRKSADPVSLLM